MTEPAFDNVLRQDLDRLQQLGLSRKLALPPDNAVSFSSNDYLNLARHPRLASAATQALQQWGTGAGSARLIGGHSPWHEELEQQLAAFKQCEASLTFPSGYTAAIAAIPALLGSDDFVLLDRLAHASLFDGARLSAAQIKTFNHNDLNHAEEILAWIRNHSRPESRILIVTESLFSMDGDFAPLEALVALKERYGSWLMVDEAHSTGIYGPQGRGLLAELNLGARVEIQMGTLSKALGGQGGYIAGSRSLIDLLLHRARSFLFTTASLPAAVAAATEALRILAGPEGDQLRQQLFYNIRSFTGSDQARSPIQIVPVESAADSLHSSQNLLQKGYHVPAIRYPTVPKNQARLRISLSAGHRPDDIQGLKTALKQLNLLPASA